MDENRLNAELGYLQDFVHEGVFFCTCPGTALIPRRYRGFAQYHRSGEDLSELTEFASPDMSYRAFGNEDRDSSLAALPEIM